MNNGQDVGSMLGAIGGVTGLLILGIVVYIVMALPLYTIATKVGHDMAWLAWVPIANAWLLLDLAGLPWWLLILAFVPLVNLLFFFVGIYAWMKVGERMGHPIWLGLLIIVPLLGLAVPFYIAYAGTPQRMI